mmetsp:Transcript_88750/g.280852  ORF Transcript_88750/g.280852 Transcript_88750/m.280852 type:complete len:254 (-) Transcript_88750:1829-2590(-)
MISAFCCSHSVSLSSASLLKLAWVSANCFMVSDSEPFRASSCPACRSVMPARQLSTASTRSRRVASCERSAADSFCKSAIDASCRSSHTVSLSPASLLRLAWASLCAASSVCKLAISPPCCSHEATRSTASRLKLAWVSLCWASSACKCASREPCRSHAASLSPTSFAKPAWASASCFRDSACAPLTTSSCPACLSARLPRQLFSASTRSQRDPCWACSEAASFCRFATSTLCCSQEASLPFASFSKLVRASW